MLTASSQAVEARLKQVNKLFDGDPSDMVAEVLTVLSAIFVIGYCEDTDLELEKVAWMLHRDVLKEIERAEVVQ